MPGATIHYGLAGAVHKARIMLSHPRFPFHTCSQFFVCGSANARWQRSMASLFHLVVAQVLSMGHFRAVG